MTKRIVVVGAGITGLAAAHTVLSARHDVELIVLESSHRAGGLVETHRTEQGLLIEHGPDSFVGGGVVEEVVRRTLPSDAILPLSQPMHTYIARGETLYPVPRGMISMSPVDPWQLLASKLFSASGKLRMAMERWVPRLGALEQEQSAEAFFSRRFGRELVARLIGPMLGTIYHTPVDRLSMQAILPSLLRYERDYGSVTYGVRATARKQASKPHAHTFQTVRQGMGALTDRLAAPLSSNVKYNTPVQSISRTAHERVQLELGAQGCLVADAVILTTPSYSTTRLVERLDPELADLLGGVQHSSQCAWNFAWQSHDVPHPMQGTGFIVAADEQRTLRGCTWSSAKWAERAPKDKVLIRCYLDADDAESETSLRARVLNDLRELMGIEAAPYFSQLHRRSRVLPRYEVGHTSLVSAIMRRASALDGIHLAGNTYDGVNLASCIESGQQAALSALRVTTSHRRQPRAPSGFCASQGAVL
jgi:oxygen-dependent protoporphyrinogen oxidase